MDNGFRTIFGSFVVASAARHGGVFMTKSSDGDALWTGRRRVGLAEWGVARKRSTWERPISDNGALPDDLRQRRKRRFGRCEE